MNYDRISPLRGGSWDYFPFNSRSASRDSIFARDGIGDNIGLRLVKKEKNNEKGK